MYFFKWVRISPEIYWYHYQGASPEQKLRKGRDGGEKNWETKIKEERMIKIVATNVISSRQPDWNARAKRYCNQINISKA